MWCSNSEGDVTRSSSQWCIVLLTEKVANSFYKIFDIDPKRDAHNSLLQAFLSIRGGEHGFWRRLWRTRRQIRISGYHDGWWRSTNDGVHCLQSRTNNWIFYAMSKSNIGEPFLLATYTSTIRDFHLLRKPGVYASVSQKSSSDDHVTVAVQADGVHILDVSCFMKNAVPRPKFCIISHKWVLILCLGIFTASCNIAHDGTGHIFCLPTFNSSCYIK